MAFKAIQRTRAVRMKINRDLHLLSEEKQTAHAQPLLTRVKDLATLDRSRGYALDPRQQHGLVPQDQQRKKTGAAKKADVSHSLFENTISS